MQPREQVIGYAAKPKRNAGALGIAVVALAVWSICVFRAAQFLPEAAEIARQDHSAKSDSDLILACHLLANAALGAVLAGALGWSAYRGAWWKWAPLIIANWMMAALLVLDQPEHVTNQFPSLMAVAAEWLNGLTALILLVVVVWRTVGRKASR